MLEVGLTRGSYPQAIGFGFDEHEGTGSIVYFAISIELALEELVTGVLTVINLGRSGGLGYS
ncbi:hypothetical protein GCM10027291_35760 [Telluribacter humicola]